MNIISSSQRYSEAFLFNIYLHLDFKNLLSLLDSCKNFHSQKFHIMKYIYKTITDPITIVDSVIPLIICMLKVYDESYKPELSKIPLYYMKKYALKKCGLHNKWFIYKNISCGSNDDERRILFLSDYNCRQCKQKEETSLEYKKTKTITHNIEPVNETKQTSITDYFKYKKRAFDSFKLLNERENNEHHQSAPQKRSRNSI